MSSSASPTARPPRIRDHLLRAAEHSCVVLQTLRKAVPVELKVA